ncbi:hypothetical protein DITRI_Ditri17bG0037400 [Diplodiscus trichospermus]
MAKCEFILALLHDYEVASGQLVNMDKSSIFFSTNMLYATREQIKQRLGVSHLLESDRYLVGKCVLIQAVAQMVPLYAMNCFRFPIVNELHKIVARYWWGSGNEGHKIHWMNWQNLCLSKLDGGLEFRDFEAFNLAFLAKQGWRFMQDENTLCFRVFKARFCWKESKLGQFSVKSAYHVARRVLGYEEEDSQLHNPIWRMIWSTNLFPKVKIFMWHLLHNILPLRSNLVRRGLAVPTDCCSCRDNYESAFHVFFECAMARSPWMLVGGWIAEFVDQWADHVVFWLRLWTPGHIVTRTIALKNEVEAGLDLLYGERHVLNNGIHVVPRWNLPVAAQLKMNMDAAYQSSLERVTLGFVLRNSMGEIVFCACIRLGQLPSVMYAETLTILFALEVAWEQGFSSLMVESDASSIIIKEIVRGRDCL